MCQMNLCAAVTGGACSPDSPVCEVDDTAEELTGLADLAGAAPARTVTYDELEETVVLEYRAGAGERQRVRIRISCDSTALEPEITLVLEQPGEDNKRCIRAMNKNVMYCGHWRHCIDHQM